MGRHARGSARRIGKGPQRPLTDRVTRNGAPTSQAGGPTDRGPTAKQHRVW